MAETDLEKDTEIRVQQEQSRETDDEIEMHV